MDVLQQNCCSARRLESCKPRLRCKRLGEAHLPVTALSDSANISHQRESSDYCGLCELLGLPALAHPSCS